MMRDVSSSSPSSATKTSNGPSSSSSSSSSSTSTTTAPIYNNTTPSSLRTIELQLNAIINELSRNGMISGDISNVLSQLVVDHDSRILFAYEDYDKNQQGENLIDKLLKVATNILKEEEAGSISKAHGITSSNSNNKSKISTNRTNMDKFDTDDKVISKSDSSMDADNEKASFCSLSKVNAISTQKAKYDEDNDLLMDSYKQCIEVLAIYRMIRELKTRVIHRFQYIIGVIDLTCLEEAALRLAIARNDDSFRNAIEQFRIDMNENRFKMNLKEVALSVIRDIRNKDDDDDDFDYIEYHDYLYEDSVEDEEKDDEDDEEDDNDGEEDDNDDDNDDDKDEEEEDEEDHENSFNPNSYYSHTKEFLAQACSWLLCRNSRSEAR